MNPISQELKKCVSEEKYGKLAEYFVDVTDAIFPENFDEPFEIIDDNGQIVITIGDSRKFSMTRWGGNKIRIIGMQCEKHYLR
jgi:hypothetical protein